MEESTGSNKTLLYVVIILLALIIIGGGIYLYLAGRGKTTTVTTTTPTVTTPTTTTPTTTLSEQPNKTKFNEFFSDAHLSKLPLGEQIGPNNNTKTTTFDFSKDQFCSNFTVVKEIPANSLETAIYDVTNQSYPQEKMAAAMALKTGGIAGCQTESLTAGKYEYKIYVDDVLVAVLPFEVK